MLREINKVKQIPGELRRRWFTDEKMDLFVWIGDNDVFSGFQLSYDKPTAERAITWKRGEGYQHTRVDEGSRPGHHPGSPLLVADGTFDASRVLVEFLGNAKEIDETVVRLVEAQLKGLSVSSEHGQSSEGSNSRVWFSSIKRLFSRLVGRG